MVVLNDLIRDRARAAIELVARKARVRAAYVFGSQADGTANEHSDIDIAAFIENAEGLGLQGRVRLGVEMREQAGDDIEVHFLPAESLDAPPSASFAAYVLRHGVCFWEDKAHRRD
jgi:predicted nucleotidyltransferase